MDFPEANLILVFSDRAPWRSNLKQLTYTAARYPAWTTYFRTRVHHGASAVVPLLLDYPLVLLCRDHVALKITETSQMARLCFLFWCKHAVIDTLPWKGNMMVSR